MLDLAVKTILRQRTRTILTVIGIAVGIAAIVALGSVAEGINSMVGDQLQVIAGKIIVYEKGSSFADSFMSSNFTNDDLEAVRSVSGVHDATPVLYHIEASIDMMSGSNWFFVGMEPDKLHYFIGETTKMESGEMLEDGDRESAIVGSVAADILGLQVGDYVDVKGDQYQIIGIIEKIDVNDVDNAIIIPIEELQNSIDKETFQIIYVIPEDVTQVDDISKEIENTDERFVTLSGKDLARQMEELVGQLRFYTTALGGIAAVVGGLGVMNTMIMSVMERRREIGVMKAIGATNRFIIIQILTESAMISLIGGLIGLGLGFIGAIIIGAFLGGMFSALVTPGLALTGVGFALLLGFIGGLYPAKQATSLDPVEALRYE